MTKTLKIRDILKTEYQTLGKLMIDVYSTLDGFPGPDEQPAYYKMLANIGRLSEQENTRVLVALSRKKEIIAGVVYISEMSVYGSGGTATLETNASGIRLLAVDPASRGAGAGKALTNACINLARENNHTHVILHTTQAMKIAWQLYENLGFQRALDLDFMQQQLPVFGFRLKLNQGQV